MRRYVSVAALLNYIASDRPGLLYPVKECLRTSSAPSVGDMTKLKRIVRYNIGSPRRVFGFGWQCKVEAIVGKVDADFTGC